MWMYAHLGTNIENVKATMKILPSNVDMEGLVEADMIIEIKIQISTWVGLYPTNYIEKILKKVNHFDDTSTHTPLVPSIIGLKLWQSH